MDQVRYGVVGAGWISQIAFMPAVAQTGNSRMTAIVSGSPDVAAKLADFHGIGHVFGYDDYDRMLAEDLIDAVYIALPNSMHADYAIRAARAGKHLLVEKPLALTVAECEAMIAAAAQADVRLMTAYRLHSDPGTVEALERIRAGEIGEPRVFSAVYGFQADPGNHRLVARHWGGPLQDIGIYCLNAARHIFGAEPVEAIAMRGAAGGDARFAEVEEAIAVTLRFPGARFAQFTATFGTDPVNRVTVAGTGGVLAMDPAFNFDTDTAFRIARDRKPVTEYRTPGIDHFGAMTAYFSDCVRSGTRPVNDGEEGLADVRALRAIERAAETGAPQRIESPARPAHPYPDSVRHVKRTDRRLVL